MAKNIKKIFKSLLVLLVVIILLPLISYFLLQSSWIQTRVSKVVIKEISENLNADFQVEKVELKFFNRLVLHKPLIKDQKLDTLIYADLGTAYLRRWDRKKRALNIKTIVFDRAKFYLDHYEDKTNLKFIVEELRQKDTTKSRILLNIDNITLKDSKFRLRSDRAKSRTSKINFADLHLNELDLEIKNLQKQERTVDFDIKSLTFKESHGFDVINLKTHLQINPYTLSFGDVTLRTPNSFITADSLSFRHKDFKHYRKFAYKVKMNLIFNNANLSFTDLAYFYDKFSNINENIILNGRIYGKVNSLNGRNVIVQTGEQTEILTNFDLEGLPNIPETFTYFDIKYLSTLGTDLEFLNSYIKNKPRFEIPENINMLGKITYKGNFTGFFDDFVAYGKFSTEQGDITTDISLRPEGDSKIAFNGDLATKNFDVGLLMDLQQKVGKLDMDANIAGAFVKDSGVYARTKGNVYDITVNDYNYQNLQIDGFLTKNKYDGYLSINDPNVRLNFRGQIDFSQDIPIFAFDANIPKADLYGLNIDKNDTTSNLSCRLYANFIGNSIDNAIGIINVFDTRITKRNEQLIIDTISINSVPQKDTNFMTLRSSIIDADLKGKYQSSTIVQSLQNLYYSYLPSMIDEPDDTTTVNHANVFNVSINLKNTQQFSRCFFPSIILENNSKIDFSYNSDIRWFQLNADFPRAMIFQNNFTNLKLRTISNDSIFTTLLNSQELSLSNAVPLENFNITSLISQDRLNLRMNWFNQDSSIYEGNIFLSALSKRNEENKKLSFELTLLPSQIVVNDSVWNIDKAMARVNYNDFILSPVNISHNQQKFLAYGRLSMNPEDSLFFKFSDVQLGNANVLMPKNNIRFGGVINGEASFANFFNNPVFYSNLEVDSFSINDILLGKGRLNNEWILEKKAIQTTCTVQRGNLKSVDINGFYYPESKDLDYNITGDKLNVKMLYPVLDNLFTDINGIISGNVRLTGKTNAFDFNGDAVMQKVSCTVDYLNTNYSFTTPVKMEHNILKFIDSEVYDENGNQAIINGDISLQNLKNIAVDMNIDANNLNALNTTGRDNESFYGNANMTGVVNISGAAKDINITISARTEKNTSVMIPLVATGEAGETNFLTFVNSQQEEYQIQNNFFVDLSGITLNFDLEVTPDAEAQLIFDSKIGDVINAKGEGNLKLMIDQYGDFSMSGEYDIVSGDYLFTLQNIINKKFNIESGSKINWNGAPYEAIVDINAAYNLKTSLSTLLNDTTAYYKKRIPIDCQIYLTENLMNPNIEFDIELPTSDAETRTRVQNTINTPEKMNRQFLSLMVINSFVSDNQSLASAGATTETTAGEFGAITTTELLSNQLSHWLSQISDEWDIGVNYRPGDEISRDQVEVALSTQILNDRVTLDGNVEYGNENPQTADIVGDFNLEVKITDNGKLRFRAFNETNDKYMYRNSPYTQGLGISYREEFDTFGELFARYWRALFTKKKSKEDNE